MPPIRRAKPHPRFGANQAQAERNRVAADHLNALHALKVRVAEVSAERDEWRERAGFAGALLKTQEPPPRTAIDRLVEIPFREALRLGLIAELKLLHEWTLTTDHLVEEAFGSMAKREAVVAALASGKTIARGGS